MQAESEEIPVVICHTSARPLARGLQREAIVAFIRTKRSLEQIDLYRIAEGTESFGASQWTWKI